MKSIIPILCLFLILACKKDEMKTASTLDCIDEVTNLPTNVGCDPSDTSSYFCELVEVGDYQLEESSKLFMPQYCLDLNSILTFKNNDDRTIDFQIDQKRFFKSTNTLNTFQPCSNDPGKNIAYCINNEILEIQLSDVNTDNRLIFWISTIPDIEDLTIGKVGDQLRVLRQSASAPLLSDFSIIINQRTLTYERGSFQEFYPSITLQDQVFQNVHSMDISSFVSPTWKYYLNQEIGLIGFEDEQQTLWVIDQ